MLAFNREICTRTHHYGQYCSCKSCYWCHGWQDCVLILLHKASGHRSRPLAQYISGFYTCFCTHTCPCTFGWYFLTIVKFHWEKPQKGHSGFCFPVCLTNKIFDGHAPHDRPVSFRTSSSLVHVNQILTVFWFQSLWQRTSQSQYLPITVTSLSAMLYRAQKLGAQYAWQRPRLNGNNLNSTCCSWPCVHKSFCCHQTSKVFAVFETQTWM